MLGWTFLRKLKSFFDSLCSPCFSSCWELEIGSIPKKVVGLSFYIVHFFFRLTESYIRSMRNLLTPLFPCFQTLMCLVLHIWHLNVSERMGHLTEIMNRGECTDFSQ